MKELALVLILTLIIIFVSCKESRSPLVDNLNEAKKIEGEIISKTNKVLSEPLTMVYSPPFLIYSTENSNNMLDYFHINSGTITDKIYNQGKGPNELMAISSLQKAPGDEIFVYDNIKKKIFETVKTNEILLETGTFKSNVYQAFYLDKGRFITSGFFNDGRFRLSNNDTVLFNYKELICAEANVHDTSFVNMGYLNCPRVSPNKTRFANIIFNTEVIETFSVENDSIKKIWSFEGHLFPVRPLKIGKGTMAQQSGETFGFKDLCVTDRYVYATYSKDSFKKSIPNIANGNYLFVFTWNGNIQNIFQLDYSIRTIAVSPDDKFFYGTTIIDNDVKIVEYVI